jgi:hypothetical protein
MSEKRIFISYRRDDVPGYVARLEDYLEKEFGEHSVFRDVEDIAGGTEWREAIDNNPKASGCADSCDRSALESYLGGATE